MLPLTGLHSLASSRGDGLRPELLDLLCQRENMIIQNSNVVDLNRHKGSALVQAGPNPISDLGPETPDEIVKFRKPERKTAPEKLPSRRHI